MSQSYPSPRRMRTLFLLADLGSAVALLGITGVVFLDVTLRLFFSSGVRGAVELSETLLVILVFLALAGTHVRGGHVGLTILTDRLPPAIERQVRNVILVPVSFFLVWLGVASGIEAFNSFDRGELRFGLLGLPAWPARAAVPLGVAVLVLALWLRRDKHEDVTAGI